MNRIQLEDCRRIGDAEFIDWERFRDTTILITGATGLIGSNFVHALAYNSREKDLNMKLILPVRNESLAKELFGDCPVEIFHYELGDVLGLDVPVDYVVHLASPTSSKFFMEKPVDTILANLEGNRALLDWAAAHPVKKYVELSTMEVYGFPSKGHKVKEYELGAFETMNARNSYPIAKQAAEALCNGYYVQYGVPAVILRATQTFGPGVKYEDGRVFAEFMRCAVEKRDIVLKSDGSTERCYLYTADAVSAILVALLKGEPGQAYTVANKDTYCSIREMAELVAEEIAGSRIKVIFDIAEDVEKLGYAKTLYMDLDTGKMEALGWRSSCDLRQMYERMIESMQESDKNGPFRITHSNTFSV
uniref:Nucleoside-diphosphate-sugar epimerase n=1 Tax=Eubacterium cellulosolvens (strain ATCC 43171 / JCM 9499 / 6) TaxID=633697 RepID=I5AW65_EUBC6